MKDFLVSIKENKLITISALFVLIFCKLNFTNTEFAVYESYNRSIAYDLDLNITNQFFFEDDKKILTPRGYYYTHHNYGASITQVPFFIFSKVLGYINGLESQFKEVTNRPENSPQVLKPFLYHTTTLENFENKGSSVGSIIIFFVAFFLLIKEFTSKYKEIYNDQYGLNLTLLTVAGPALFYLLFAQSTPNLVILFPLFLIFHFSRRHEQPINHYLLGLSFGLGFIIRQDFAIYGLFICLWWYLYKPNVKKLALQASGLITFIVPSFIYEYNKLGSFQLGYFDTVFINFSTFIDLLFSGYGGLLVVHPIILFVLIGSLVVIFKIRKERIIKLEFSTAIIVFFIKTLFLGLTFSHNGGVLGGRQLIQDYFLICLFLSFFIPRGFVSKVFLSFFALANFFISLVYNYQSELKLSFFNFQDSVLSFYTRILSKVPDVISIQYLFDIHEIVLILVNFIILILLIAFLFHRKKINYNFILYFLALLNLSIVTSDLVKGRNIQLKDNELRTSSMNTLMYYENMGSIIERIGYLTALNNNANELNNYKDMAQKYHYQCLKELNIPSLNIFEFSRLIGTEEYEEYFKKYFP